MSDSSFSALQQLPSTLPRDRAIQLELVDGIFHLSCFSICPKLHLLNH
ncbi:MAG: hypothetical protein SAJ12_15185 [Jaaginema sp. PMC 1079.18]|nr:hypothetical protein [Jaaginema sp. PMC 1080.18]MEC4852328.1 hypothetical protein [Jaaginema sp. PMC 1079.18]MEC4867134.1 hypothetical protein [Jaaginema sp. PMC 1078.18]